MFDSRDHCRLCGNVLDKSKYSVPSLFNQFEVLISTADKLECLGQKFFSRDTLDTSGVSLTDFLHKTETLLNEIPTKNADIFLTLTKSGWRLH